MKKNLPLLLLGIAVTLAISAISLLILYFGKLRPLKTGEVKYPLRNQEAFDEVVITHPDPSSRQKEILSSVILNKLTFEGSSLGVIEVGGESKAVMSLVVSFDYQGKSRRLTIPIVETISLSKAGPQGFEEGEVTSVTNINLEKGKTVNVGFSYIPIEEPVQKSKLVEFCGKRQYKLCLMYLELGFGDSPTDFNTYLENTFEDKEAVVDYKIAYPNTLFLVR